MLLCAYTVYILFYYYVMWFAFRTSGLRPGPRCSFRCMKCRLVQVQMWVWSFSDSHYLLARWLSRFAEPLSSELPGKIHIFELFHNQEKLSHTKSVRLWEGGNPSVLHASLYLTCGKCFRRNFIRMTVLCWFIYSVACGLHYMVMTYLATTVRILFGTE